MGYFGHALFGVRIQSVQRVQKIQGGWQAPFWGHAFGVRVQRGQRVQKVQRGEVGGFAASINKNFTTGLCLWKTSRPPVRAKGYAVSAYRHCMSFASYVPCTEIHRLRLRMTGGRRKGRRVRTIYSSPKGRYHNPQRPGAAVKLSPSAQSRSNLRTFRPKACPNGDTITL